MNEEWGATERGGGVTIQQDMDGEEGEKRGRQVGKVGVGEGETTHTTPWTNTRQAESQSKAQIRYR